MPQHQPTDQEKVDAIIHNDPLYQLGYRNAKMKAAIQFSGGKDSLALVYHMEALLPHLDVVMVDTGDMTGEAYRNLDIVKSMTPNVWVIRSDSKFYRKANGPLTSGNWIHCCQANIWGPMADHIKEMGYRQVFRGTKRCDKYLHGVFPGDVVDGVIYTLPLWEWSEGDVRAYLGDKLPAPYRNGADGMPDCASCPVPEVCGGRNKEVWHAGR